MLEMNETLLFFFKELFIYKHLSYLHFFFLGLDVYLDVCIVQLSIILSITCCK